MLYADISTPIDSIRCKFPCEPLALYTYFEDMGIECPLSKVRLTDHETDATRIKLSGDTEVHAHLAKLFSRKNTLYDVNTVATVMEDLDERIREELEKNIVNDAYSSVWELRKGIRHLMYELGSASETFFFPISGYLFYDEEYRWGENADTDCLLENEDTIRDHLRVYLEVNGIYMHEYYDGLGSEKLTFAEWGVEEWEGALYGTVSAQLTEPFTEEETEAFKDWIFQQNAEYFGDIFSMKDIKTDDGILSINLWTGTDDYFIFDYADYGDDYEVGNDFILDYKGQVEETLMFYANMGGINMAEYYDANGKDKLLMADWGLETLKGTVYGKVDIRLTEPFTPEETAAFKDWTLGQNSDGLGEGFEQQDIKTDEGALNVSFWHSGDDYFIYTQEEMDEYINQNHGMNMEGM